MQDVKDQAKKEVDMWKEIGRTVRTALSGWGPTVRLVILLAAATAVWIVVTTRLQ